MSDISLELIVDNNQLIAGSQGFFKFKVHYHESLFDAPVQVLLLQDNQIVLTLATEVVEDNEVWVLINEPLDEGTYVVRLFVDNRFMLPHDESQTIEVVPNTISNQLQTLSSEQREEIQEMATWLQEELSIQAPQPVHQPVELLLNQRTGEILQYWAGPESELPEERDPNTIYDVWSDD